jgi:hypothetical protein
MNNTAALKAIVFATTIHFYTSLIFESQAKSLPLEWNLLEGSKSVLD